MVGVPVYTAQLTLLGALLRHNPLPTGYFVPAPWPVVQPLDEAVPWEDEVALPELAFRTP